MLQIDVRELRHGSVSTDGELGPADSLFEGLMVPLEGPLVVAGMLERAGPEGFFWHGRFSGQVRSVCRRCLTEFVMPVEQSVEVMFSADPDLQEDPGVYPLAEPLAQANRSAFEGIDVEGFLARLYICQQV